jgi:hypothetical protein
MSIKSLTLRCDYDVGLLEDYARLRAGHAGPHVRFFGLIDQNASESWLDTCGWLISFQRSVSEAIRPAIVPVPESYDQWYAEAIIFRSGKPTLILPEKLHPRPFELKTSVIAWDFSRRAARCDSRFNANSRKSKEYSNRYRHE